MALPERLIASAKQIRETAYSAIMRSARRSETPLKEQGAMWVMRMEAWRDLQAAGDFVFSGALNVYPRRELFGLPIRLTIDDEPDTPMIQLVTKPPR